MTRTPVGRRRVRTSTRRRRARAVGLWWCTPADNLQCGLPIIGIHGRRVSRRCLGGEGSWGRHTSKLCPCAPDSVACLIHTRDSFVTEATAPTKSTSRHYRFRKGRRDVLLLIAPDLARVARTRNFRKYKFGEDGSIGRVQAKSALG
jgi:hypothetical protein